MKMIGIGDVEPCELGLQREPVQLGHEEVEHEAGGGSRVLAAIQERARRGERLYPVARADENARERAPQRRMVVHEEDARRLALPWSERDTHGGHFPTPARGAAMAPWGRSRGALAGR